MIQEQKNVWFQQPILKHNKYFLGTCVLNKNLQWFYIWVITLHRAKFREDTVVGQ